MKVDLTKPEQVFEALGLEEHSVYVVRVKAIAINPEYTSILYTGFKNGNYCMVYKNTTEAKPMMSFYSLKVVKKLYTFKDNKFDKACEHPLSNWSGKGLLQCSKCGQMY